MKELELWAGEKIKRVRKREKKILRMMSGIVIGGIDASPVVRLEGYRVISEDFAKRPVVEKKSLIGRIRIVATTEPPPVDVGSVSVLRKRVRRGNDEEKWRRYEKSMEELEDITREVRLDNFRKNMKIFWFVSMMEAIKTNNVEDVDLLLSAPDSYFSDNRFVDEEENSLAMVAYLKGDINLAQELLSKGVSPTMVNKQKQDILHLSIPSHFTLFLMDNYDFANDNYVDYLYDVYMQPDFLSYEKTELSLSILDRMYQKNNHASSETLSKINKYLIPNISEIDSYGIRPDIPIEGVIVPIPDVNRYVRNYKFKQVIERYSDSFVKSGGYSQIIKAISFLNFKYIESLSSDLYELKDKAGNTPLMHAVMLDRPTIVEVLLNNGADPNAVNYDKETPLDLAIAYRNIKIARILIVGGADYEAILDKHPREKELILSELEPVNLDLALNKDEGDYTLYVPLTKYGTLLINWIQNYDKIKPSVMTLKTTIKNIFIQARQGKTNVERFNFINDELTKLNLMEFLQAISNTNDLAINSKLENGKYNLLDKNIITALVNDIINNNKNSIFNIIGYDIAALKQYIKSQQASYGWYSKRSTEDTKVDIYKIPLQYYITVESASLFENSKSKHFLANIQYTNVLVGPREARKSIDVYDLTEISSQQMNSTPPSILTTISYWIT